MKFEKSEILIIKGIKKYAKAFLENMGGFYPFAIGLNNKDQIVSIAASNGEEFPDSKTLIDLLEKSIPHEINKKEFKLAAICVDVFIKKIIDNKENKRDAIEIRFISSDNRKTVNLFYKIDSKNKVSFDDIE